MEEKRPCSICGSVHPLSELTEFDDALLCECCLHANTFRCQRCGTRIWRDNNAGDDETTLCQSCYDRHYTTCEVCGRTILQDDAYYDDDDSYEAHCYTCQSTREKGGFIHDYYYKPPVRFFGTDSPLFLGVELELDSGGESNAKAAKLMEIANAGGIERAFCKHDGSLNQGFEIVSHAMTLSYHEKEMPWKETLEKAKALGYLSHTAGSCGLHVHVSRSALGETPEEQDAVIARILFFLERNWDELRRFSRRTHNQISRWCARYGYQNQPAEILKTAKQSYERYTCLNLSPPDTVEFRLYRGSLRYTTFLSALQLTERICQIAICLTDEEIKALTWCEFVAGITKPELIQYLKERRLYVSDPVETEAEI